MNMKIVFYFTCHLHTFDWILTCHWLNSINSISYDGSIYILIIIHINCLFWILNTILAIDEYTSINNNKLIDTI